MHFINGTIIFPLIYAFLLYRILPGRPWAKGIYWGLILWFLAQAVVMPMMGGGFFSASMGGMKAVIGSLLGTSSTAVSWDGSLVQLRAKALSNNSLRSGQPEHEKEPNDYEHLCYRAALAARGLSRPYGNHHAGADFAHRRWSLFRSQ
jgi:hypothetical protein